MTRTSPRGSYYKDELAIPSAIGVLIDLGFTHSSKLSIKSLIYPFVIPWAKKLDMKALSPRS
jgi:hypothetical protein